MTKNIIKSTTIVGIRKDNLVVIAGDGQASLGNTVMKSNVKKIRRLGNDNSVISGFAGSTADAFALFERLEGKLDQYKNQLKRACVELAKDWRTDRYLRRLEAMMIVADKEYDFKDAFNKALKHLKSGKAFEHLTKLQRS